MTHYIYHLIDPRDKTVRYVGKTTKPKSRLRAHIKESQERQNTEKKRWIAGLLEVGLEPVLVIVASLPDEPDARILESDSCKEYAETIFNIHDPAKGAKDFKKSVNTEARK